MSKPICTIAGCKKPHEARGWCRKHYARWRRLGDPLGGGRRRPAPADGQCTIESCGRPHHGRGFCSTHYARFQKYGDPLGGWDRFDTPEESYVARTVRQGDCLVWVGRRDEHGYGQMRVNKRTVKVHRFAWELKVGPIPPGVVLDHICHNPSCSNIEHLRLATRSQNCSHLSGPDADNKSSGVRNVYRDGSKFRVQVRKDGVIHYFGMYETVEEAAVVAERVRLEMFGEFAGSGERAARIAEGETK